MSIIVARELTDTDATGDFTSNSLGSAFSIGDLLICQITKRSGSTFYCETVGGADWKPIFRWHQNNWYAHGIAFAKIADADDINGQLLFSSGGINVAVQVLSLSGHDVTLDTDLTVPTEGSLAAGVTGISLSAISEGNTWMDSPSVTPSWGADASNLFCSAGFNMNSYGSMSHSDPFFQYSGDGLSSRCGVGFSYVESGAASYDPAAWTLHSTGYTGVYSLVIKAAPTAETHYIDPVGGDNANDGLSSGAPKETWAALEPLVDGDTYLQKAGTTATIGGALDWGTAASGSITIGRYDTGADPIISGGGSYSSLVDLSGASNIAISNIRFTNNSSASTAGAISAVSGASSNITFTDCTIDNVARHGIRVTDGTDWTIDGCTITDVERSCIYFVGAVDPVITDLTVENWGLDESGNLDAVYLGAGSTGVDINGITSLGTTAAQDTGAIVDVSGSGGASSGTVQKVIGEGNGVGVATDASTLTVQLCDVEVPSHGLFCKTSAAVTAQHNTFRSTGSSAVKLGFSGSNFTGSLTINRTIGYSAGQTNVFDGQYVSGHTLTADYNAWDSAVGDVQLKEGGATYDATDWFSSGGHGENSIFDASLVFSGTNGEIFTASDANAAGGTRTLTLDALGNAFADPTTIGAYEVQTPVVIIGENIFDVTGLAAGDYTAYFYQVDGSDVSDIVSSVEFTIASSGITSSPVAGALTLTGYAPAASVIDRATVTPTAGALVLTGYAPTAQSAVQLESSPVAGALVLTEHTPSASIVDRATVTPTAGALVLTGYAPTAQSAVQLESSPVAGALVLTEHTPSASIVDRATVTPTAGALALTGYAPSADLISADAVAPGAGTVDITGYAPSTTSVERATVVPVTGTATLTGYAPDASVIDRAVVAPTSAAVSIAGSAPTATVFSGAVVLPAAGAVTIAGKAPTATLFGDITTSPASDALTLTGYAPTASSVERATVSPGADTLVLTGYAPAASFGLSITTNAGALAFTGYAASLTLVLRTTATPTSAALAFTGGVPSVSVLGPSTASPSAGTITFVGNAPTVSNSGDTRLGTSLLMVLNAPDNVSENLDPKSLVMRA